MALDDTIKEIAAGLRDAICETSEDYLRADAEDAYIDLAARFVLRLARLGFTVTPTRDRREIEEMRAAASVKILNVFTRWLQKNPDYSHLTSITPSGRIQIVLKTPTDMFVFHGVNVQDAYAQAAQTLCMNEDL